MILNLTDEQRNYVKITYSSNRFEVNIGEKDPIRRKYYSVDNMLKEFKENEIEKAEFDDKAHFMFDQGDEFITERDKNGELH